MKSFVLLEHQKKKIGQNDFFGKVRQTRLKTQINK